jgi:DNA-binding MarR family transcriptional regulator
MGSRASTSHRTAVANALHSAAIHLLRAVRQEDAASGVGPAQLSALSVLVFAGAMRLTDLARLEQVRPPTMTRVIAGLQTRGLVKRRVDETDARALRLEATAKGTALLQRGRRRRVERLANALSGLSREELDVLAQAATILEQIAPAL